MVCPKCDETIAEILEKHKNIELVGFRLKKRKEQLS